MSEQCLWPSWWFWKQSWGQILKAGTVSDILSKADPPDGTRNSQQQVCEQHCGPACPPPCIPALPTQLLCPLVADPGNPNKLKNNPTNKANSLQLVKIPEQMATDGVASWWGNSKRKPVTERDYIRADLDQPQVLWNSTRRDPGQGWEIWRRKTVLHPAWVGNVNCGLATCGMGIHLSVGHTNSVKLLMHSALQESHGLLKKGDQEGNTSKP